ncbi:hypothetical protein HNQ94_003915 [Salirhabdus euzebyi]|uniref:CBM6 domain-containing protein n=1 Tax=Salirhabdus euzebyi TaxID=394506 RepID=A0A841QAL2_9BACI|nr:hypothetical protein [Salirhabdus euzebyi]MBB6455415.1 hypothetical protein [Salirhabdus euzebyi]
MKKIISLMFLSLVYLIVAPLFTHANTSPLTLFSVGESKISENENKTYQIATKGLKSGEGFVFTASNIKSGKQNTFQFDLKGAGNVVIKVVETNIKGKFIKETTSKPVTLSDQWKTQQYTLMLSPNTKEMDVMVLTEGKQQITFQTKNIAVKQHKQPTL